MLTNLRLRRGSGGPDPENKLPKFDRLPVCDEAPGHQPHTCAAFAQAPHQVRKPFRTEWDVDTHPAALAGKGALQIRTNSVIHLEFIMIRGYLTFHGDRSRGFDH